jgi:hypothetical protein
MLTAILAALLPFVLNGAMELTKWLTKVSSTPVMRFILAVLSTVGVISFSAANGTPLDTGTLTGLIQTSIEALLAFFAAHGTYSLLTGRTAPQPQG